MKKRHRRDIFVVGFVVCDKLRGSGIIPEYAAPTELADFYFVVLQICRTCGAGEGKRLEVLFDERSSHHF